MARIGAGIGLVGRRHEMSALAAALDRAAAGSPTGVLLSGDAGVGKSRLVAEAVERAGTGGFRVLTGRCLDTAESAHGESALPYLPFTEVVGALAATQPELVAGHVALRHLLPGVLDRSGPEAAGRDLGQLQVFDAVLSVLDELSAATPTLLVLEDLHWADRSSRDLLVFLLSRLDAQRLTVLATYRSDDLHRRHPLRAVLAELVRLPAVERVDLAPLLPDDALELVRQLADGSLSGPMLHRVAARSEGNAFFAEELVSACSDGLPSSLVEVLLSRVEQLPAAARRLLRVAAVAGPEIRHDQLAAVTGLDVDELEQGLREAIQHHVLVADGEGYTFRHALLREAIETDLLPGERSRLHGAFAALLADPAAPDVPGRAALLAHHALAAHDLPGALAASARAAREADDRAAPAELLLHAERALELWSAVPDAEAVAGEPEYRITRKAAWAASATGDPERGAALARRAMELAELRGDPRLTAKLRVKYAIRLMDRGGDFLEAREAATRAMEVLLTGPPSADLAWCHAVLARAHYRFDEFADATREAERTLAVVGELADTDDYAQSAGAQAFIVLAGCEAYAGRPEQARGRLAVAREMARRAGDLELELNTYSSVGYSLVEETRFAEAAAELAAGDARASATGLRWSVPGLTVRVVHVVAQYLAGEWDAAEVAADLAGAAVAASVSARLVAAGLLVAAARGRVDVVERRWAELNRADADSVQSTVFLGVAAAESALWDGRPDDTLERASTALDALRAVEPYSLGGIALAALGVAAHAERAAVHGAAAELAGARALARHAELTAAEGIPRGVELGAEGRAWLARARAELTRLTGPDPAAWDAAVTAYGYEPGVGGEAHGYQGAYALLRRAEAVLATGGADAAHEDAVAALLPAHRVAVALRAVPLAAAVAAMAVRAGVRFDDEARAGVPDVLTPRERTVLAQVARGLTNRQIGAELFISEKTVSVHLSRVMAKLGAGSRTEAVSRAYARGLLDAVPPGAVSPPAVSPPAVPPPAVSTHAVSQPEA